MSTTFNIRAFGALGDGITDDTMAIQKALDAAGECKGTVIVEPGIYACGSLQMRAGTALEGTSAWSFRSFGASIFRLNDPTAHCLLDITGAFGCRISGMSLDGAGLGTQIHGIQLLWPKYNGGSEEDTPTIDDCRIGHFTGDGVHLEHIWCFSLRHSMLFGNHLGGLYIDGWDGFLLDNWFTGNQEGGLRGGPVVASITATGNRVEWNHLAGFYLPHANCCNITGNYFDRTSGPALWLGSKERIAESVTATGNIFYRNGKPLPQPFSSPWMNTHIMLTAAKNCTISGNIFRIGRDDGGSGEFSPDFSAVLKDCTYCIVKDNTMHEAALKENIVDLGNNETCLIDNNIGELFTQ